MPKPPNNARDLESLRQVTRDLRGDEGCPWDKEQTHASLSRFAIEEAFELAEAIDSGDNQEIKNELGDVLFQVFLHSEVARQSGTFTLEDVVQNIVEKMVRRHPHVFRETRVKDAAQVVSNWEQIKREERGNEIKDPLETPRGLPALLTALKIGAKTKGLKFDWTKAQDVLAKVKEELTELEDAMNAPSPSQTDLEHEIGDVLFSVAQLARHLNADPEQALRQTNARFRKRFQSMLDIEKCDVKGFADLSAERKEDLWSQAKRKEK